MTSHSADQSSNNNNNYPCYYWDCVVIYMYDKKIKIRATSINKLITLDSRLCGGWGIEYGGVTSFVAVGLKACYCENWKSSVLVL